MSVNRKGQGHYIKKDNGEEEQQVQRYKLKGIKEKVNNLYKTSTILHDYDSECQFRLQWVHGNQSTVLYNNILYPVLTRCFLIFSGV